MQDGGTEWLCPSCECDLLFEEHTAACETRAVPAKRGIALEGLQEAEVPGTGWSPKPAVAGSTPASVAICPACASADLAKIKGCVRCLRCGFKEDCNGW